MCLRSWDRPYKGRDENLGLARKAGHCQPSRATAREGAEVSEGCFEENRAKRITL